MARPVWAIVVGEYAPQPGGVADYTRKLAHALAAVGDEVHVYAPPCPVPELPARGVHVHRMPDRFGVRTLRALSRALAELPGEPIVLVQYVAQSFGMRGCNVPFALWLRTLGDLPVWLMFHEVTVTVDAHTSLKYRIQAVATDFMAWNAARAADQTFVSTPLWEPLLRSLDTRARDIDWTPVPSNIPTVAEPDAVARIRKRYSANLGGPIVGHFGTYREAASSLVLMDAIPALLADPERRFLLLGAHSDRFLLDVIELYPHLSGRIAATGMLDPQDVTNHLAACTVLVQPFEDGVTTRRGSISASLALGVPTVTVEGATSEPLWRESQALALCATNSAAALVVRTNQILNDPSARYDLTAAAQHLYADRFAVGHTVDALYRRSNSENIA